MGNARAVDAADGVAAGLWELEDAVRYHLLSNHFPPVPECMVEPCVTAIREVELLEEDAESVSIAGCGKHRVYGTDIPAAAIVEGFHLEAFITREESEG